MHKGLELSPPPLLGVESPFGESFSPFLDDEFQCDLGTIAEDTMAEKSMYGSSYGSGCSGSWGDDFQSLSPFGADWEMEQEFFRSDLSCFDSESCKPQGPTLAELNDQRSLSPLINPEMERLHRIATRTDLEPPSAVGTAPFARRLQSLSSESTDRKPTETSVTVEIKKEKDLERQDYNPACEFGKREVAVKQEGIDFVQSTDGTGMNSRTATSTSTKNLEEGQTIELSSCDIMKRILMERKYDVKTPIPIPKLISPEVKSQLFVADTEGDFKESAPARELPRADLAGEDENMAVHDDSADEDMDSEDDFDDRDEDNLTKSRKGRRSDTDDLSPNPRKLLEIGRELNRLNKVIGDLKPIHSLPLNARNKSRKEKNKLASRACRLKKKAQHEANKLKLHGLELEQQRLIQVIDKVRSEIVHNTEGYTEHGNLSSKVESMVCNVVGKQVVAGHTSEFIESVLKATAQASNPKLAHLDINLDL